MRFLYALLLAAGVQAVEFLSARITASVPANSTAYYVPPSLPTTPPPLPPRFAARLARRADSATYYAPDPTCGWISGVAASPFVCAQVGASCAYSYDMAGIALFGCCRKAAGGGGGSGGGGSCSGYHLACIGSKDFAAGTVCDRSCQADDRTLKCTDPATPYCNSLRLSTSGRLHVYGQYCNTEDISTLRSLWTTSRGASVDRSFVRHINTGTTTSDKAAASTASTSGTSATKPSSTGPIIDESKSSTGAIAGGVVGGVAGLALVGAGMFFLWRRQHRKPEAETGDGDGDGPNDPASTPPGHPVYPGHGSNIALDHCSGSPKPDGSPPPQPSDTGRPMSSDGSIANADSYRTATMSPRPTGTPQVPDTIYEAGGNAVGVLDRNANHRGEIVELA